MDLRYFRSLHLGELGNGLRCLEIVALAVEMYA